ncbi:type 1 glutamine amidotransferase [Clostridium tyrobutyricum]|uniref:type 1 glutamine amidotransferase n=1 Tax=Clostridium tyrobutyricum TaxID=1519 RepID=UPI00189F4F35|nr:type 1 glutamine amidotransferase [Clostridium tyrobutyricum]
MRIHYLQHVPFEGPANIVNWAHKRGHKLTGTHLYNYEVVPNIDQFDCLVIMGGPMNIYEEDKYPWLKYEKKFIKRAIEVNKVVLGICLGAQLITDVLGGKVTKNPEGEIGWFPVNFKSKGIDSSLFKDFPEIMYVFQWHNDTFSTLGSGVRSIAYSKACKNQAFIYKDRVIGFQFHMESTKSSIFSLIDNCEDEMTVGSYVQTSEKIKSKMNYLKIANSLMDDFLNQLESIF